MLYDLIPVDAPWDCVYAWAISALQSPKMCHLSVYLTSQPLQLHDTILLGVLLGALNIMEYFNVSAVQFFATSENQDGIYQRLCEHMRTIPIY